MFLGTPGGRIATTTPSGSWMQRFASGNLGGSGVSSSRPGALPSGVPYTAYASGNRLGDEFGSSAEQGPLSMSPQGIAGLPNPMMSDTQARWPNYPYVSPSTQSSTIGQSDPAPVQPKTAKTNYVPTIGTSSTQTPPPTPTPAETVAYNRLLLEKEQATPPATPEFGTLGEYDPATYNPLTIQEIDSLIDTYRNKAGFLTEAEIQKIEDERKNLIADIINRESDLEKTRRLDLGQKVIKGTEALYTNMAGGPANIASGTIEQVSTEIDKLNQAIEVLDQQRIDDITKNDVDSAKRVEDRIDSLFKRKNELEKNRLDQIKEDESSRQYGATFGENSRQFAASYGIDLGNLEVDQENAITAALKLNKEDALDAAKFLVTNFGSMATEGLSLEEVAALETAAKLPFGSLMRSLSTIDQQKANQLEFVSGTKYQQPGSFDKNTGLFTPIASALRYIDESGDSAGKSFASLPPEMQSALLAGYEQAPDKDKFITQTRETLGKGIAGDLLIGGGQSAYRNQPELATIYANTARDVQGAFEADPENMTPELAQQIFARAGVTGTKEGQKLVDDFIETVKPAPWYWPFGK